jgi:DoxX-like family
MEFVNSHPAACAWAGRALGALVTLALLADAAQILFSRPARKAEFAATGFADSAATPLGIIILVCAILFAVPQTSVLGAILVTGFLGGAICTHFRLGAIGSKPQIISAVLGLMTWGALYLQNGLVRSLLPFAT